MQGKCLGTPRLSAKNRAKRSTTCNDTVETRFFNRVITGDKWVSYHNPVRKKQWLPPNKSPTSTAKPTSHSKKALCVFGGICVEFFIVECLNLDKLLAQVSTANNKMERTELYWKRIRQSPTENASFCHTTMPDRTVRSEH